MNLIDSTLNKFLNTKKKQEPPDPPDEETEKVEIFFKNQMNSNYKQQEDQLRNIIKTNLESTKEIKLRVYYRNMKLKNLLIRNQPKLQTPVNETSNVVYRFQCPEVGCSANTYIGYTTNKLVVRMTQHYSSGAIREHAQDTHDRRFNKKEILDNTTIIKKNQNLEELKILESLCIKQQQPTINRKDEGFTRTLKIF